MGWSQSSHRHDQEVHGELKDGVVGAKIKAEEVWKCVPGLGESWKYF